MIFAPVAAPTHPNRSVVHHTRCLITALALTSCAPAPDGCEPNGDALQLHDDVREASGVAASRTHDDVLWIHNDSDGGAAVFAFAVTGEMVGKISLNGARNDDWEDLSVAPCPDGGPDGDCLFIADIGDNRAVRESIGIWIAAEPIPGVDETADAVFVRMHYPDGPRDAEAVAILEDGSALIVSKGREHPVSVYRSAPLAWPAGPDDEAELTLLSRLSAEPASIPDQVTGADVDRDGRIVVRTYASLQFYRLAGDSMVVLLREPTRLDSLGEPQGEGVAYGRRGALFLVSEAGPQAIAPRLTSLKCRLP